MKFGYMFYQKPLNPKMKSRPINLGDAIQSYAVKNLFKEMGIDDKDMVPIPKYDMAKYDGDECICVVNGISTYEEVVYETNYMPPSNKIHPILMSLHIHRNIPKDELEFYIKCGDVGCRDLYTVNYLKGLGVNAYLTGCLTLTLPKRSEEESCKANKVYIIDVSEENRNVIPDSIKKEGILLSNIYRHKNVGDAKRLTFDETLEEHRLAEERIELLRRTARLVITGRLHIAAPCLAMGIPVILLKKHYGDRFGFIDRLVPMYTPETFNEIDWNPKPIDIENIKRKMKQLFFSKVETEICKIELEKTWKEKKPVYSIDFSTEPSIAIRKIDFPAGKFKYAVWGVILQATLYLEEAMKKQIPRAELIAGIDIAVEGEYYGVNVIKPEDIKKLPHDTIIIVAVPSAHEPARKLLLELNRPFVLMKGTDVEIYNF